MIPMDITFKDIKQTLHAKAIGLPHGSQEVCAASPEFQMMNLMWE
jgi:hypothetical protein